MLARSFELPPRAPRRLASAPAISGTMPNSSSSRSRPLAERSFDWLFVVGFGVFVATSLLFDVQTALDLDMHDPSANPLVQANAWFARTVDPILLDPPLWFRVMCGVSAFVYGPFYIVLVYAFVRGRDWIRVPALMYASAILLSMVVVWAEAAFGSVRPRDLPFFMAVYAPYALLPVALIARMRHPRPFTS